MELDQKGELLIAGNFAGLVTFPSGVVFQTYSQWQQHGFSSRLSQQGETKRLTRIGSTGGMVIYNLLCDTNGSNHLVLGTQFPIIVNGDTVNQDSADTFMAILTLDTSGMIQSWNTFAEGPNSEGGYAQSTMDPYGNLILEFYINGIPSWDSGSVSYQGTTIRSNGHQLAKLNPNLALEWTRRTNSQPYGWGNVLDASPSGEIYFSSDDEVDLLGFVEKYDSLGNLLWVLKARGDGFVSSQDLFLTKDFIYWTGYYQCEMILDSVHFRIGDTGPCTYPARDGFICLINKHTGKVAWVMSEGDSLENKHFSKIIAIEDDHAIVAAQINSPSCTIDTLNLQNIAPSVLPYTLLFRLDGLPPFPVWPEIPYVPDSTLDFAMWPNPTNGTFTLQVDESWSPQTQIEIYNMAGQRLWMQRLQGLKMTIDLYGVSSQMLRVIDLPNDKTVTRLLSLQN
jgi:hypothetical protein